MSAHGVPASATPPLPPATGGGGCCSSGATLEMVAAFTAVCLVLYGAILYLNYLYVRWSGGDGVHRTTTTDLGAARKRAAAGIDKAALAAMPVVRFVAARDGDEAAAAECAVCLCGMQDGDAVRALPGCGHAFHAACVDAWLCARATCPVCRARPALPPPQRAPKAAPQPDLESQV
ncbi:hypothetical protein QOZ80_2BG0161510 [Eleusine coracana subsp. coracana]|nr:hypothetical protein QOZ80_2BG0161510 [Eleusine coracana subsp. coracana]